MNTYKTSDLTRLYTCKSKLVCAYKDWFASEQETHPGRGSRVRCYQNEGETRRHPQQSFTFHTLPYLDSHLCPCSGCINAG